MAATEQTDGFGGWLARLASDLEIERLDSGPPPQVAEAGNARCVFAGRLHGRTDPSTSDAEFVLNGYLRQGERILDQLKGEFAFALWDGDTLLCARDRLGIYPLFRAEANGHLLVSTSIRALLSQAGVAAAVNLLVLVDHLRHRWLDSEETFFEAVRRVPPGHALVSRNGAQRVFRYWDPAPPDEPVQWITADELERFDGLLQAAVERCASVGETGIFLSGGLDSVSVAAFATDEGRSKPWALSLAFPEPSANEEEAQRAVASRLGMPQLMLSWDDAVPRGLIPAALELSGELTAPLINLWAPAYDELGRQGRQRGCRVILTGTGGDEWLGVTPYYAADLIRRLDLAGLGRLFLSLQRSYPLSARRHVANVLWQFGTRPLVRRGAARAFPDLLRAKKRRSIASAIPAWLAPDPQLRRELVERDLASYSRSLDAPVRTHRAHPVVYIEEMRTALEHPLVSMEMEELFEQGRRLGVALRHPFLDADLIEFLYRTPPELLNRGGRSKSLVREAVARRLPDLGLESQRKVAATGFVRQLIAREGVLAWHRTGGVQSLAAAGAIDPAAAGELAGALGAGPPRAEHVRLWDLLTSEAWIRGNADRGS